MELTAAIDVGRVAAARARRISVRPRYVLGSFVVVQWLALLGLALTVRHDGWLYYQGGDQLWHYTGAWLLAHGNLPVALVGYGWSFLLVPVAAFAGPSFVNALPAVIIFNGLVLAPIALLAIFGIADRIAGRAYAYGAAALWIAMPLIGIRMALPGYHQKYTEVTLPQSLGLTAMSDFPSMVALMVSAYFCLRALERSPWINGAAAGLSAGYALAIKPSNTLFLVGPAALFLFYGLQVVAPFLAGIAPSLLALAVWKDRGLGQIPAFSSAPARRFALGATGSIFTPVHRYIHIDWSRLNDNRLGLKEHFWSERIIDWLVLAGLLALFRRSRRGFALVAPWFVAYLLVKGGYAFSSTDDASFFRLIMPLYPAFVLMIAAIPFLIPRLRVAGPSQLRAAMPRRQALALLGIAVVVFALTPLALVASAQPLRASHPVAVLDNRILIPVDTGIDLHARVTGRTVTLAWHPQHSYAHVFAHLFRSGDANGGLTCAQQAGSAQCTLAMSDLRPVNGASARDHPGGGRFTYRIAMSAAWVPSPRNGDVYAVSNAVTVRVP